MSLYDRESANQNVETIYIQEIERTPRTESFGESTVNDFAEAMGPAANITNSIYRKKALKAIKKRNRICKNQSAYINYLANANVGNNLSVAGNMSESFLFQYIIDYCKIDIKVHKRNMKYGKKSTYIENKMQHPPVANASYFTRLSFCHSIRCVYGTEVLVNWRNKLLKKNSQKIEAKLNNPPKPTARYLTVVLFCAGIILSCAFDVMQESFQLIKEKLVSKTSK